MVLDIFTKEEIAKEKRFWLRTTKRCNNHCIFCHDSEVQDGSIIDKETLKRDIKEAFQKGYNRLILSGGEPTIHPDIIELVLFAKICGYDWIQIISNGRMFAYKKFTESMINAGLNEVTISFHSHKREILESLTDSQDSYRQTIAGIENLKRHNIVLSIDIVLNRFNIGDLRDTIRFFHEKYGISEFDLLYVTPFGRAFENYEMLRVSPIRERRELRKAILYAKENGIVIWTNRVPPNILEGNEEYIQDPHKILDEIYGRSEIFSRFLSSGILECRHIRRCPYCFVRDFCEFLVDINSRYQKRRIDRIEITSKLSDKIKSRIFDHISYNATIIATPESLEGIMDEVVDSKRNVIIKLKQGEEIPDNFSLANCKSIITEDERYLTFRAKRVLFVITNKNIKYLQQRYDNVELIFPNSNSMRTEYEDIPGIDDIKRIIRRYGLKISNLPRCISGDLFRDRSYWFRSDFFGEYGLNISAIAEDFLLSRNYHKSLRCKRCIYNAQCKGLHINHIRRFGFKILKPIQE
ncbi:MAG: radical SAM protein [Deltaproteobacteria bacterium]|nr:radical SAM protein [Deltaproteobacteria bacterium]